MTSLTGLFSAGVSGMNAFSSQLDGISTNIANLSTIGFKVQATHFNDANVSTNDLLNQNGIVQSRAVNRISQQGAFQQATDVSNLAVNGNGYFAVQTPFQTFTATGSTPVFTSATTQYTRQGDFEKDANGYLVNSAGNYLQGIPLTGGTSTGVLATAAAVPIQLSSTATSPGVATANVTGSLNFPPDAATGAVFNQDVQIYDSTGASQSVPLTWTKLATPANSWSVAAGTLPSGIASVTPTNGTLTFNDDGTLAPGSAGAAANGTVSIGLSVAYNGGTATSPQAVALNLGTAASGTVTTAAGYTRGSGSTQVATGAGGSLTVGSLTSDGYATGSLTGFTIGADGVVSQTFSNNQTVAVYRIPLTTFPNADGLKPVSSTLFAQNDLSSGVGTSKWPGESGAGKILPQTLELSTADTTQQFTDMIQAQRAYSANSKTVTTADEMMSTAIGMLR